jgi:GT2 family glycosyltransferase
MKMDLSVIIVNYNVKYFLEQCLHTVLKATQKIQAEVIVVDNNSVDGSAGMIAEKFPQVNLLTNTVNFGFAKANNQAIRMAAGRYVLLLNPDTVIQEDTFLKCIDYMDHHADVACMGVKMIDGKGDYLPESKRALPTPVVAFYKVFGLAALFPRSERFGKYHLGYLNRDEIHDVDVISGAFMFIRKPALDKTGLLDEKFFMYGEDIDLSYRFKLAGYRNIYFPLTTIIHYKGESTRKSSINYVIVFYRAMIIFARKHFTESTVRYYSFFIHLAIYFRAGLSIFTRFFNGVITPLLDALVIFTGYLFFLPVWEHHLFGQPGNYPAAYLGLVVPAYILVWLLAVFITTGYEKKVRFAGLLRGVLTGSLLILVIYALLPENWRFSRALILIGTLWVLLSTISVRYLLSRINKERFSFEFFKKKKRIIIIGDKHECNRVYSIIAQTQVVPELIGYVNPYESQISSDFIGHIGQIEDIVHINQADEIVFCAATMTAQQIIRTMLQFTDTGIEFKIAAPESMSVIGSNSNDVTGELYVLHFNTLSRLPSKRKKRMFDIVFSLVLLIGSPVILFTINKPLGLFSNILGVFLGIASWVGYYQSSGFHHPGLPMIRPGILTPLDLQKQETTADASDEQGNLLYAKDYKIIHDLRIIIKGYANLGRRPLVITYGGAAIDKPGYGKI